MALSLILPARTFAAPHAGAGKPLLTRKREHFPDRPAVKTEIPRWRAPNTRHYLNPDGTFTAEVFRENIFYEDPATRVLLPIDNGLTATDRPGFTHANGANRFTALFPAKADAAGTVRFESDGSALSFRATGASSGQGQVKGNSITYPAAYPGVDLKYEVLSSGLKESIILASADAPATYSFALSVENLAYQPLEDGSVAFFQPGKAEPALLLPKPFMYDSGSEPAASQDVTQTIRKDGDQLFLDVVADPAWLGASGREFPVVIDPTVVMQPTAANSKDTFASSAYPTTSFHNQEFLIAGNHPTYGTNRSFLWFKLPSLPSGARIDSAKFSLYMYMDFTDTTTVQLRRVTSSWNSTSLTWNNQPSFSGSNDGQASITGPGWYDIWATGLVADWYNANARNYGVALLASPETDNRRSFRSGDNSDPNLAPKLAVNYTVDPVGDQSFWTYAGNVNPFNGNLMVKAVDLSTPGRGIPVTIARTYNSRGTLRKGLFGYGWSSGLDLKIAHTGWAPPIFWDATGTRHIFQDNDDGTFSSPPGIHYSLTFDGVTSTYKIKTLDSTVYTFDSAGRLTKITDANGQATTFNRDLDGTLTSITDASGRVTYVSYNASGYVSSITDPAGRTAAYTYDSYGNLTAVDIKKDTSVVTLRYGYASGTNRMTSTTDPNGKSTTVGYDTANNRVNLIALPNGAQYSYTYGSTAKTGTVTGPLGREAIYAFNDIGNVTQVDVVLDSSTKLTTRYKWDTTNHVVEKTDPKGNVTTIDYNANGQPVMAKDANGISTTMNYDANNNRTSSKNPLGDVNPAGFDSRNNLTESFDALGNASLAEYASNGNLLSSTSPVSMAENLVNNPGFEDGAGGWDGINGSGAVIDTEKKSGGYQSVRIQSTTNPVTTAWFMDVVPGAHYTLSADVLTDSQASMRVRWYDANKGQISQHSNLSLTNNSWGNWRRKSTHVDAPTGARFAKVELVLNTAGNAWFDNVQFETGSGRWGNNALVNPGFDYDRDLTALADFWYPPNPNPGGISIDYSTYRSGVASEKIVGESTTAKYVAQRVDISGDSTTRLAFSGWARSVGGTAGQGWFAMQLDLVKGSSVVKSMSVAFNPEDSDWHKRASVQEAGTSFDYVMVYAFYSNQTGTAWFDDFEVHKHNPTASTVTEFNYVENSSMELDRDNSLWPDGWLRYPEPPNATVTWEGSANAYVGERSVSIKDPTGTFDLYHLRKLPYDASKTYTATGYVKAENFSAASPPSVRLVIHFYDSTGAWKGSTTSSGINTNQTDWARLNLTLSGTAPSGTAYFRVGVQMTAGAGKAYVDNIRLLEGEKRSSYTYNSAGNYVTAINNQLGQQVSMSVDANTGTVASISKPLGSALTYTYDWLNRLSTAAYTYQGSTQTFRYNYDANSNLTSVLDPYGVTPWTFGYNSLNQLTSAKEPVSGVTRETTMSYDELGNLLKVNSPNGTYTRFEYDNANRVTKSEHGTGTTASSSFTYEYDLAGNLSAYSGPYGENTLTYDPLNRLTKLTRPFADGTHSTSFAYDAAGNPITVSYATPGGSWSGGYKYDARGLVSKLTENRFGKNAWYLYSEAGQMTKSYTEYDNGGYATFVKYDGAGRLTELLTQNSQGQARTLLRYAYDQNGNVTRVDDDLAGKYVRYTYDELDQLIKEEYWTWGNAAADTTISYTYDALGNRTSMTKDGVTTSYGYNAEKNRLTAVGGASYQYDSAGNLTSDGSSTYTWDHANRLQKVTSGTNTYSFTYDASGRRASKTVNGTARYYHYNGDKVAYVTDASGSILQIFTYDGAGRPLYLHQNGTLYQYHYNGHGDVIRLTDMAGATVATYQYDAWGNITQQSGTLAASNPYRYAGYWYDEETKLYYLNARYYKPDIGRFISKDSWGGRRNQALSHNRYVYTLNNPANLIDPTGYWAEELSYHGKSLLRSIVAALMGYGVAEVLGSNWGSETVKTSVTVGTKHLIQLNGLKRTPGPVLRTVGIASEGVVGGNIMETAMGSLVKVGPRLNIVTAVTIDLVLNAKDLDPGECRPGSDCYYQMYLRGRVATDMPSPVTPE